MFARIKYILIAAGIALIILLGIIFIPGGLKRLWKYIPPVGAAVVETDTLFVPVFIPADTIVKTQIKYVKRIVTDTIILNKIDTVLSLGGFTATDTLITRHDTIQTNFLFPEMEFKYLIYSKPDTLRYIREFYKYKDTVDLSLTNKLKYGLIGFGLGLIIGLIK